MRIWPGQPYPLGATWTGLGVNFAIFACAEKIAKLTPRPVQVAPRGYG